MLFGANGKVRLSNTGKVRKRNMYFRFDFEAQNEAMWIEDESAETPPVVDRLASSPDLELISLPSRRCLKSAWIKAAYELADGEYDGNRVMSRTARYPVDDAAIAVAPPGTLIQRSASLPLIGMETAGSPSSPIFCRSPGAVSCSNYFATINS